MKKILSLMTLMSCLSVSLSAQSADTLKTETLNQVVVTGARTATDVRQLSQTVTVIDRGTIAETNRASFLPLLAEQVPGLFITARGTMGYGVSGGAAGNISMRGLSGSSSRFLVLIDGHPQYAGIFGHPIADACQSLMAERVEVLSGPASLLYGSSAMGGVINVVTRKQVEDGMKTDLHLGYGSWNTLESELSSSIRKGRFSSVASASYNRTDGHRDDMDFQQYGGQVRLGYDISSAWKVSADFNATHFDASQPGSESSPLIDADQKITRGVASLYLENDYGKTSGAVSVFYNWGHHWINDGYAPGATPKAYRFVSDDSMAGISAYQSAGLFKGNRTTFGLDWFSYGGKANNVFVEGQKNGTEELQVDKTENELAAYVDFRQNLAGWLTLNAGLRADHHFSVGTELVPQVGLAVNLPRGRNVKLSATKGFRYPTLREMYMYVPKNPELDPESLWNYELAYSRSALGGKLSYGVNLFHIDAKNIILTLPNPNGAGKLNQNSGELHNSGVELKAAYHVNRAWAVDANYSFLHMKEPVIAAPEHKLHFGASFTKGIWHASAGAQYVAGLYTSTDPVRQEDFVLVNARVAAQVTKMVNVWINGDNLLNSKYQINAGYPMPGASVMLGVNLSF